MKTLMNPFIPRSDYSDIRCFPVQMASHYDNQRHPSVLNRLVHWLDLIKKRWTPIREAEVCRFDQKKKLSQLIDH